MHWFTPLRLPFLVLTPACVAVGIASAHAAHGAVDAVDASLCVLGGLCAHAGVNAFNEHADFESGLDFHTVRTPFSGGSGALPARPELAASTLAAAWIATVLCAAIGIWFVARQGSALLPIGAAGLVVVLTYSRLIVRSSAACLLAPGLGFGPLMILGTAAALTGRYDAAAAQASAVVFFVVSNLLLLNQFPDREPDRAVGRRNVVIALGYRGASVVYAAFLAAAAASLAASVAAGALPTACLVALIGLAPGVPAAMAARHFDGTPETLQRALGLNVVASVATPALLAAGLLAA